MLSTLRALLDLRPPRRYRYGPHRQQVAELHLPPGDVPHPVVVALHGGYWRAPRGRRYLRPLCADLARHGFAAWNVEYRRVGRGQGGGWPETFEDVAAGIDLLASLGGDVARRLDLERVVALGHSAGGHLAVWAAARPGLPARAPGAAPRVAITAGAVALGAVIDLEAAPDLYARGGAVHDLMRCAPGDAPDDRYELGNPIRRLPVGVPLLLVHGLEDETVPPARSRAFAEAARAAGDDVTLVEPLEADHHSVADPRHPEWHHTTAWLADRRSSGTPR